MAVIGARLKLLEIIGIGVGESRIGRSNNTAGACVNKGEATSASDKDGNCIKHVGKTRGHRDA